MIASTTTSPLNRRYLFLTVFTAGMTTLAIEFTTSRLLQTVYGTSNIVWANVIGLVLLCLTIGYFLGGRWADRRPSPQLFYQIVALAGFLSVACLLLTAAILRSAATAMASVNIGAIAGSMVGVILALAAPIILLGCVSPFAIRLGVRNVGEAGRISGLIYAVSTWGSLLGTYLPVLLVIPEAGTRLTAVLFGTILMLVGLGGLWQLRRGPSLATVVLPLLLLPLAYQGSVGPIKSAPGQIFETESAYNYIQVVRDGPCNFLLLNEGQAYHSYYCDGGSVPRISVWSIMLAASYFNEPAVVAPEPAALLDRLAVVGLAAGTIPKQFTRVFGPVPIDGIELDPAIVAAGREFFALDEPNIHVIVGDGRYAFNQLDGPYDVVTIDAYKVPYIPWHLTTSEYYAEIRSKLSATGVVAINVGRAPADRRLVEAVTATLLTVFPTVHTVDVPDTLNTILFATVAPTDPANMAANVDRLPSGVDPLLTAALETAVTHLVPTIAGEVVFTDERAPVETIIDSLVIRYLLSEGPSALPGLR